MMIEKVICDYLTAQLSVTALPEKPKRPFGKAIFVEKTGGRGKYIYESTFAVQSYANSKYEAAKLNDEVIEAMLYGLLASDEIVDVKLNSNYDYTDTTTKEYRYQAVFDITHY